jgi:hypothetical protein
VPALRVLPGYLARDGGTGTVAEKAPTLLARQQWHQQSSARQSIDGGSEKQSLLLVTAYNDGLAFIP